MRRTVLLTIIALSLLLPACARIKQELRPARQLAAPARQVEEKRLTVPADKLVSRGRLSSSANSMIRQSVAIARAKGGIVQINYPVDASEDVVHELLQTGANLKRSNTPGDYILIVTKPQP
jgi:hypothetical protein